MSSGLLETSFELKSHSIVPLVAFAAQEMALQAAMATRNSPPFLPQINLPVFLTTSP
jgi:hypothetical protein